VEPSGRLLKVPAIGVAAVFLIKIRTIPWVSCAWAVPLRLKVAPLLIVTPLAITLSIFDLLPWALKV